MSQSSSLQIHVNTIMGDADLKHFSYDILKHPSTKSVKHVRIEDNPSFLIIEEFLRSAHVLANCRLLSSGLIVLPDLLDSSPRYFHIKRNLFCRHLLLFLANDPMDLALVQFHNPCYGSGAKACAKYFWDSTFKTKVQ